MRHALALAACLAVACRGPARDASSDTARAAADTSAVEPTEPDIITEADTTGPGPEVPRYVLFGNEPFWSLTIDSAGLRFRTPEDTTGVRFGTTTPVLVGDSLRWNSVGDEGMVEAIVAPARCSDGMSDSTWSYRARLTIGKREYTGCARRPR